MKNMFLTITLFCVMLVLAACGGEEEPTPIPPTTEAPAEEVEGGSEPTAVVQEVPVPTGEPQIRNFDDDQCLITFNQATNTYDPSDLGTPSGQVGPGEFEASAAYDYDNVVYWQLRENSALISQRELTGSTRGDCVANPEAAIQGKTWVWTYQTDKDDLTRIFRPVNYQLTFNEDGTYSMQADCNSGSGGYTVQRETSQITLSPGPMTLAECGPDSLSNQFVAGLSEVVRLGFNANLVLQQATDGSLMVFLNNAVPQSRVFEAGQCQIALDTDTQTYQPGPAPEPTDQIAVAGSYDTSVVTEIGGQIWYSIRDGGTVNRDDVSEFAGDCTADPPALLPGGVWQWTEWTQTSPANQSLIADSENYLVKFLPDYLARPEGTFLFQADCNNGSGGYIVNRSDNRLALQLGPTTIAACGPDSSDIQFTSNLGQVERFQFNGDRLVLHMSNGDRMTLDRGSGDLAPPEAGEPTGTVIAADGLFVRTGPGTGYPTLTLAPYGTSGRIVGRSEDAAWWVFDVQGAPDNQGWAFAQFIFAENADGVPVIPVAPPPQPTALPPTATPSPSINFWADRTVISQGECTNLHWQVENVRAAWVYALGSNYQDFPVTGDGSRQECPSFTTTYELRIEKQDGTVEFRQVQIQVVEQNPLANTSWQVAALNMNSIPIPGTSMTLSFVGSNGVSANGGCNTYNSNYSVFGNGISFGAFAGTQMSCGADIDSQERLYLNNLQAATTYESSGGQLILRGGSGQELVRFDALTAAPR